MKSYTYLSIQLFKPCLFSVILTEVALELSGASFWKSSSLFEENFCRKLSQAPSGFRLYAQTFAPGTLPADEAQQVTEAAGIAKRRVSDLPAVCLVGLIRWFDSLIHFGSLIWRPSILARLKCWCPSRQQCHARSSKPFD